jgi:parallel beta-helix repeat protein
MKSVLLIITIISMSTCADKRTKEHRGSPAAIDFTLLPNKDTLVKTSWVDSSKELSVIEEVRTFSKEKTTTADSNTSSGKINYLSLKRSIPASYTNISNLVIEGLQFSNHGGNNLSFKDCENITIRNCYFGESAEEAISIEHGKNFTIENNLFANNKGGIYALQTKGGIVVRNNQFINVKGPLPRGQYVQLDDCSGPGNRIENNKGECWPGESDPEDLISVFKSSGTAESPILIRNNIFRGGGPSTSGGGIMTGDTDGGYVIVENNILVDPGQYGIAAAGGTGIVIRNNKVYARAQKFTNVGIYVWAQGEVPCADIEVSNNQVYFMKGNGAAPEINSYWDGGNCGNIQGWETNKLEITPSALRLPSHLIDFVPPDELNTVRKMTRHNK